MSICSQQPGTMTAMPISGHDDTIQGRAPEPSPGKLLNVTITIHSITGVLIKESGKKKSLYKPKFTRKQSSSVNEEESIATAPQTQPTTTIVTSFARDIRNDLEPDTRKTSKIHVSSVPLSLPPPKNGKNSAKTCDDVIIWPEQGEETHSKLSSFTFQRYFPRENVPIDYGWSSSSNSSNQRYVPQLCPIQVSISRNGTIFKLGNAHVFLSGEEYDESYIDVPVVNFERVFKFKPANTIGKSRMPRSSGSVKLMRLKNDTLKCGLAECATLRVLVKVSNPITPTTPVNHILASLEHKRKKKEHQHQQLKTDANTTGSNQEYDPDHVEVVLKKKTNGQKNLSPPSSVVSAKGRDNERRNKIYDPDDEQSHSTATSFSTYNSEYHSSDGTSSTDESTSSIWHGIGFSEEYLDEEYSLYSESSANPTNIISTISMNRSHSNHSNIITMSSSVQSYQRKQRHARNNQFAPNRDDSSVSICDSSSTASSTSIDSPPTLERLIIPSLIQGVAGKNARARATMNKWGRRLACCGSHDISSSTCLDDDMVMESIYEAGSETPSYEEFNDQNYCFEGRKHSLANTIDTDQTPW